MMLVTLAFLAMTTASVSVEPDVQYSGDLHWDEETATCTFVTSGEMPSDREGFFWNVPARIKRIVIEEGVRVTGGFRITYREKSNPLWILGKNRTSSIIFGTNEQAWTQKHAVPENDKWRYSAVSVVEDAVVHVQNLTVLDPRGYLISGYANEAVIHVDRCNLRDSRAGDNNNSDGFAGASGSSVRNTLISTADDGIKCYNDITIENVTIEHHRNGAPLQFGWGNEPNRAIVKIKNIVIRGVDPDKRYNMAPLTWEQGSLSVRDVQIDGLVVRSDGTVYDEGNANWRALGLFELKPDNCVFNLEATAVELNGLPLGLRRTRGKIKINGAVLE